jgi:hypothetical protein
MDAAGTVRGAQVPVRPDNAHRIARAANMRKADKKTKVPRKPSRPSRLRGWWGSVEPGRRRSLAGLGVWAVLGVLFTVGSVVGMRALRDSVLRKSYHGPSGRAFVRLTSAPEWMPEALARDIVADLTPADANLADPELARKVYECAAANPWVRGVQQVRVRPNPKAPGGTVEATLQFRQPLARVRADTRYLYVDADGFHLPINQVPIWVVSLEDRAGRIARQVCYLSRAEIPAPWQQAARKIHYVMVDGVTATPPPPGWRWPGEDLAAALRLVQLVQMRSYYAQITVIDARNHACRITKNEPELRMYAQMGQGRATDIRFGRFPAPGGGDYVISPQRKMSYLDDYAAAHGGQLAGFNTYLDLRYDELHVSIN